MEKIRDWFWDKFQLCRILLFERPKRITDVGIAFFFFGFMTNRCLIGLFFMADQLIHSTASATKRFFFSFVWVNFILFFCLIFQNLKITKIMRNLDLFQPVSSLIWKKMKEKTLKFCGLPTQTAYGKISDFLEVFCDFSPENFSSKNICEDF